jgi:eukaryotic-like serine/threonine-protein kinase
VEETSPEVRPGGTLAGRYRLERLLATGGMAQVWEATDDVLARPVAVKILHPHLAADESFVTRFRREAVAVARLAHPSIVSIYDTCSQNGTEAIVMELVQGTTLRRELDERDDKVLPPAEAVSIVSQVADALECAHRGGVIHRDVKPANILLSRDGRVLVTDFGIAKAVEESSSDLTKTGTTLGTVKYLAPEQIEEGPIDARTDVYALGVVLYELLCGRPPFTGDTDAAAALARLHRDPLRPRQVRADVPRELEVVVMKAVARRPEDRYASAAELRAALLAAGRGELDAAVDPDATAAVSGLGDAIATVSTPVTPPRGTPIPTFRQTERSWFVPTALVVVVAVALGVAGVLFSRTEAGRDLFGDDGGGAGAAGAVTIASVTSFDPQGNDGAENDELVGNVSDGDPGTLWETVGYNSRRFGNLKDGVGVVLNLGAAAELDSLVVRSPTQGWAASVYVADRPAPDLAGWGDAVAEQSSIAGDATFDLGGAQGQAVLLWITDLGDGPPRVRAEIGEIELTG